jgi:hypothetical protein
MRPYRGEFSVVFHQVSNCRRNTAHEVDPSNLGGCAMPAPSLHQFLFSRQIRGQLRL